MNVHFIAIGGSAMHNLAIAMHLKGDNVAGSDDEIFEPSKGRLEKYALLPDNIGWNENLITNDIDAVILGMHARKDNPELLKAQELGLKIYSYPEFIYEKTKNKTRVVIGGSHGKTTITSMILHVLRCNNVVHDYMVGAQLEGFECMVSLSEEAEVAVLEGDEYLSSPIDLRPKFHLYKPTIGLISGIAWDHINVFPTFENYIEQFKIFVNSIDSLGSFIYYSGDEVVNEIKKELNTDLKSISYTTHKHVLENGITHVIDGENKLPIQVFGEHNLQNLNGALKVCMELNISKEKFYTAIQSFKGASKRLELVKQTKDCVIYKDFAHSPSKLKATTKALSDQFPKRKLIACMELHTFSSLNHSFLKQYKGTMESADKAFVYFNPETLKHKKLANISIDEVVSAFATSNVEVLIDSSSLVTKLLNMKWENQNLLLMSSGNFDGLNFDELANRLIG